MSVAKYWIATVSKEHAMRGVSQGFMQVCHGKQAPLQRIKKGDFLIVYSSKITMQGNEKCQAFTAIGQAVDDRVYQFEMNANFKPYRRNFQFLECNQTSILPLINELEFIPDKKSWGYPFRYGFFEINKHDFNIITSKMVLHENYRQCI